LSEVEGVEKCVSVDHKTGVAIVNVKKGTKLDEAKVREAIDKDYTYVSMALAAVE
jgi:hypothetical protein